MTPPADGDRPDNSIGTAAAAIGTAPEPPAGSGHGSQQAGDVVLDVATLGRAAEVDMTARGASPGSREQRADEIVRQDSSRPAAASASSGATVLDPLEDRILKEMREMPGGEEQPCIWRVHPSIRDQEAPAYEPKLVSIGPLHRDNKSLLPMEQIKLRYLNKLLSRSEKNILINYIRAVRECETRARKQYAEEVVMDADEFVRMLVLDGCFIIEYFVKRVFRETRETAQLSGVRWGFSHLRGDLMLLENQIPFFVLTNLFDQCTIPFTGARRDPLTLKDITLGFLKIKLPREQRPRADQVHHLLHLHHLCMDPSRIQDDPRRCSFGQFLLYPFKNAAHLISLVFFGLLYLLLIYKWPCCYFPKKNSELPRMIPCATELHKAGVKFRKKEGHVGSYLKVSFAQGALEIPFLRVQESTSSELRNFIALEQCCPQVGSYFTSYAVFMDNIVNTEIDVAILEKYRIIESKLGSDKEVAKMFNTLCKGTHLDYKRHYNALLFRDVNAYCEVPHHRWRASLKGRYFSNPWSIISLVAGILLLFFAAVQSYFTAFPRK